jgi:hypothetical protein
MALDRELSWHAVFHGFVLAWVASACMTMGIRWYRHRDEILEAVGASQALKENKDIEQEISRITKQCIEIKEKNWPRHATDLVVEDLYKLRSFLQALNSGTVDLPFAVGIDHAPHFFAIARGLCFVTAYKDWTFWDDEPGRRQLESNRHAIENEGRRIVRVFILPPYVEKDGDKASVDVARIDNTIKAQLGAGVKVRVIPETKLARDYRRDLGVFFVDHKGEEVEFVSEWRESRERDGQKEAVWYFEGRQLIECKRLYNALVRLSEEIENEEKWQLYKQQWSSTGVGAQP